LKNSFYFWQPIKSDYCVWPSIVYTCVISIVKPKVGHIMCFNLINEFFFFFYMKQCKLCTVVISLSYRVIKQTDMHVKVGIQCKALKTKIVSFFLSNLQLCFHVWKFVFLRFVTMIKKTEAIAYILYSHTRFGVFVKLSQLGQ